jgi:hypothetical protein
MTISTTANRAYPWPNSDEPVSNGWDAIRDVAVAVDTDVNNLMRAMEATKAVAQSFPNGSVDTLATFDTYIGSGITAPTSARLAAPVAGTYRWWIDYAMNSNLNAYYRANVRKNAAGVAANGLELGQAQTESSAAIPAGYGNQMHSEGLVVMVANDYIETFLRQNFAAAASLFVRMGLQWVRP